MSTDFFQVKPNQVNLDLIKEELEYSISCKTLLDLKKQQIDEKFRKYEQRLLKQKGNTKNKVRESFNELNKMIAEKGKRKINIASQLYRYSYNADLKITFLAFLNINIPKIDIDIKKRGLYTPNLFHETPLNFEETLEKIRKSFGEIVLLAELEYVVFHFKEIYKQMQRTINALDEIIIPELIEKIDYINEILEDLDLEQVIQLRHIKNSILLKKKIKEENLV